VTTKSEAGPAGVEVTVTFLEMSVPPAHPPPLPLNQPIALLQARNIPLHFYRYLLDRVGRRWKWERSLRLTDEALSAELTHPGRDVRVLYLDGAPAGFFDIRPHLPESAEIAYFGMMEQALSRGLGRWFLGAAISAAWQHKPQMVTVQTCTLDHPAALPLYQKLGFSPVGQSKEIVHPLTDAERAKILFR
jgi:GNAT superfamily N-acetyltransferase